MPTRIRNEQIQKRIRKLFPKAKSPFFEETWVHKEDPRLLGASKNRAVVSLGKFKSSRTGKPVHLAIKVGRTSDERVAAENYRKSKRSTVKNEEVFDTHYDIGSTGWETRHRQEKESLAMVSSLGIPTVRSKIIKRGSEFGNPISHLIVEDLSQGGRYQVAEFHGFDFDSVANGEEISKLFESYYSKMLKAGVEVNPLNLHEPTPNLRGEVERGFFVVVDPKTKKGRLVFGDGNQIKFRK